MDDKEKEEEPLAKRAKVMLEEDCISLNGHSEMKNIVLLDNEKDENLEDIFCTEELNEGEADTNIQNKKDTVNDDNDSNDEEDYPNTPRRAEVTPEYYDEDIIGLVKTLHQTIKDLSYENAQLKKRLATYEVDSEHKKRLATLNSQVKRYLETTALDESTDSCCSHPECSEENDKNEDRKKFVSYSIRPLKKLPLCKYDYSHEIKLSREHLELAESVRARSVSHRNFAKNILQELYKDRREELEGKNTRGKRGKDPLPKDVVETIKTLVWRFYPELMESNVGETEWELCIASIDEFLRRKSKSEKNPNENNNRPVENGEIPAEHNDKSNEIFKNSVVNNDKLVENCEKAIE